MKICLTIFVLFFSSFANAEYPIANLELNNNISNYFSDKELKDYLDKISDEALYAYNVYQIEGEGRKLFTEINGDENTVMGLPIINIKNYIGNIK